MYRHRYDPFKVAIGRLYESLQKHISKELHIKVFNEIEEWSKNEFKTFRIESICDYEIAKNPKALTHLIERACIKSALAIGAECAIGEETKEPRFHYRDNLPSLSMVMSFTVLRRNNRYAESIPEWVKGIYENIKESEK